MSSFSSRLSNHLQQRQMEICRQSARQVLDQNAGSRQTSVSALWRCSAHTRVRLPSSLSTSLFVSSIIAVNTSSRSYAQNHLIFRSHFETFSDRKTRELYEFVLHRIVRFYACALS